MNIAFDAVGILGPMSKNRGIGNYCLSQFKEMIFQDKENHYFFFNVMEPFSLGEYPNLTEKYFYSGKNYALLSAADESIYGSLIQSFIEKNHIDVFYITSPFESLIPAYKKEWFMGAKVIATVYDIIPYLFKDHYFGGTVQGWYLERLEVLRWVNELLVISQSVKDDLIKYLHFSGSNIHVIWGAPGSQFRPISVSTSQEAVLRKKFHISGSFIMCTGGDDERKNIANLVEAYCTLSNALTEQYTLVIVCKLGAKAIERYNAIVKRYRMKDRVIFTNFVNDEELLHLYNLTSLVVFPSKYEGFGLPIVEAWACGKPVLTANNSSLVQIAGDAAVLVDADSIADIARGLEEALEPERLQMLAQRGKARLAQFNWDKVAHDCITVLNNLGTLVDVEQKMARLAFFTPLPPQESGIADYSADILVELANYFDIDVYIDDEYEPDCSLPSNVRILCHTSFLSNAHRYDYILYQMGNSLFHIYMYPYIKKYGGILVLHDYNMRDVAEAVTLYKGGNVPAYREYLLEDYPESVVGDCLQEFRTTGKPNEALELNGFLVNYVDKVIVHSDYARLRLASRNIEKRVKRIPLYAKIGAIFPSEEARKQLGIDPAKTVIASFGSIQNTKRSIPFLNAGIRLLRERADAILLFVGKLTKEVESEFKRICQQSGVAERILVSGYIPLEQFETYINASDICVNLRYPYHGETSATFQRALAKGKCTVVNDVGSFSEVPDTCCVKIPSVDKMPSQTEEFAIYNALMSLLSDSKRREEIGHNARDYAERELDIKKVVRYYADFILEGKSVLVTEDAINALHNEMSKEAYSNQEIRLLARVLSYCIE